MTLIIIFSRILNKDIFIELKVFFCEGNEASEKSEVLKFYILLNLFEFFVDI